MGKRRITRLIAMNDSIVLATTNKGKIAELATGLADHGLRVCGLDEWPRLGEIEENGSTFAENALIKARAVAKFTNMIGVADDSGLVVEALQGAPGIHSARFASDWEFLPGENRDDRNIRKLLHLLKNTPPDQRKARFVTVMAAVAPDGREITATGTWDGLILSERRGANGFGYDPVFFDPLIGKAAAELDREEKNARSHRGKALKALLAQWPEFMLKGS